MIAEIHERPVLIFGCGNPLLGDDGFGPAVIARLHEGFSLPPYAFAADVGTSAGDLLFDFLLSPTKPTHLFIVDAMSQPGRSPGELFEVDIEGIQDTKAADFSLHQFPSVNLLKELQDPGGVVVRILAVQIGSIPEEVRPGLSREVSRAVGEACQWLLREIETITTRGGRASQSGRRQERDIFVKGVI